MIWSLTTLLWDSSLTDRDTYANKQETHSYFFRFKSLLFSLLIVVGDVEEDHLV